MTNISFLKDSDHQDQRDSHDQTDRDYWGEDQLVFEAHSFHFRILLFSPSVADLLPGAGTVPELNAFSLPIGQEILNLLKLKTIF
jgi:hypothetical protein